MEIKYNLPQPFLRYRNPKNPDDLRAGDVVAYRRKRDGYYSTGVMIIADRNMFLVATNWSYDGELWYTLIPQHFDLTLFISS